MIEFWHLTKAQTHLKTGLEKTIALTKAPAGSMVSILQFAC